jgi:hypothetical protein
MAASRSSGSHRDIKTSIRPDWPDTCGDRVTQIIASTCIRRMYPESETHGISRHHGGSASDGGGDARQCVAQGRASSRARASITGSGQSSAERHGRSPCRTLAAVCRRNARPPARAVPQWPRLGGRVPGRGVRPRDRRVRTCDERWQRHAVSLSISGCGPMTSRSRSCTSGPVR